MAGFAEEWAAGEAQLSREADHLGELLARLEGSFASLPLVPGIREGLLERARRLPPTLMGFPVWLGFPVSAAPPFLSFNVSLLRNTRSAAFFRESGEVRIGSLLRELGAEDSRLRRITGDILMAQYDIGPEAMPPGFLLYPVRPTLVRGESENFRAALGALASVRGPDRSPDDIGGRHAERIFASLEPGIRIGALGFAPSGEQTLRLVALGYAGAGEATRGIERTGWPGSPSAVARTLRRLEARGALDGMTLGVQQHDMTAGEVAPTLEVDVFSANTIHDHEGWVKDRSCWESLLSGLHEESLALPERLAGLSSWTMGSKLLFGRSDPFVLFQRIHHIAIRFAPDRAPEAHAYVFLLLARPKPQPRPS